jgi:hypothetical protein
LSALKHLVFGHFGGGGGGGEGYHYNYENLGLEEEGWMMGAHLSKTLSNLLPPDKNSIYKNFE